jgi:hypothetical protein
MGVVWSDVFAFQTGPWMLPFREDFEECQPGALMGQNGWNATSWTGAVVQSDVAVPGGVYACRLTTGSVEHAFFDPSATGDVWIAMEWQGVRGHQDAPPDAAAVLCLDAAGHFVVSDGAGQVALTNGPVVPENVWTRFSVCCHYDTRTWDLYYQGDLVVSGLDFADASRSQFESIAVQGCSTPAYLDNIYIAIDPPVGVGDSDGDGLFDGWEIAYFGSTTNSAGGPLEDYDDDGMCDLHEFLARTDPTRADSLLVVSSEPSDGGSGIEVSWPSRHGKYYTVERATDLLGGWTAVASSIRATPPTNTDTDNAPPAGPVFYRIRLETD